MKPEEEGRVSPRMSRGANVEDQGEKKLGLYVCLKSRDKGSLVSLWGGETLASQKVGPTL